MVLQLAAQCCLLIVMPLVNSFIFFYLCFGDLPRDADVQLIDFVTNLGEVAMNQLVAVDQNVVGIYLNRTDRCNVRQM
mgnify:CR=1 FL=1|jgi:hypothetical protein